MKFVASCPSLPPAVYAGDEPRLRHMTTHGMVIPEGRLAVFGLLIKLVNI
jgi:hypothetical protein